MDGGHLRAHTFTVSSLSSLSLYFSLQVLLAEKIAATTRDSNDDDKGAANGSRMEMTGFVAIHQRPLKAT